MSNARVIRCLAGYAYRIVKPVFVTNVSLRTARFSCWMRRLVVVQQAFFELLLPHFADLER